MDISLKKSKEPIPNGHNLQMELNPVAAEYIVPLFEVEIMQGEKELMTNGQTRYTFTASPEKIKHFKKVIHQLMGFNIHNQ